MNGQRAGEQLEHDDARGVDVAALVQLRASRLLGAHVERRAGGSAHHLLRLPPLAGHAEVHQLHHAVAHDHHVLRLQVAVDDARLVHRGQPAADLLRDLQRGRDLERAAPTSSISRRVVPATYSIVRKRTPSDSPESCTRTTLGCVMRRASLISWRRRSVWFASWPSAFKRLERDLVVEVLVLHAEDLAHAALAEHGEDRVAVGEGVADLEPAGRRAARPACPCACPA